MGKRFVAQVGNLGLCRFFGCKNSTSVSNRATSPLTITFNGVEPYARLACPLVEFGGCFPSDRRDQLRPLVLFSTE